MEKLIVPNDEFFAPVVELLEQGKRVTIPVKGYSMLPFIRGERDLVELEKADEYVPGDIVLFHLGGRWIMHRILSISDGRADIMGDGVLRGHEDCPLENICGRAVAILRSGVKRVNPRSPGELRKARFWRSLLPIRRYLVAVYRRLPWNRPI